MDLIRARRRRLRAIRHDETRFDLTPGPVHIIAARRRWLRERYECEMWLANEKMGGDHR